MPVQINNQTKVTTHTPKFFDKDLTGNGKKIGILNEMVNPKYLNNVDEYARHPERYYVLCNRGKQKITNDNVTTLNIPLFLLSQDAYGRIQDRKIPNPLSYDYGKKIGTINDNGKEIEIRWFIEPHAIRIRKETDTNGVKTTPFIIYRTELWFENKQSTDKAFQALLPALPNTPDYCLNTNTSVVITDFTSNPKAWITSAMNIASRAMVNNFIQLQTQIDDYINMYDLYDAVCNCAAMWQTKADEILCMFVKQSASNLRYTINGNRAQNKPEEEINRIIRQILKTELIPIVKYLETYNIPLELYRNIYNSIKTEYDEPIANELCKNNLNLLLSDTLNSLQNNKSQIISVPTPQAPITLAPHYSKEQQDAIKTEEPLVIVQAGAGTGKSTVILERIQYLIQCGVNPEDIMVLSFTNAAADNIKAKNPNVHSMTIASMIHTIYGENFKTHELSTEETVINTLRIFFKQDDVASELCQHLYNVKNNNNTSFIALNNFVEEHYDKVIEMLDIIRQTTLTLEIIICYQKIKELIEPKSVSSKYLIIDEVQDNSIFEFIYTLRYIEKHKESLYIVGDASQTLYEFRSSNPRALNVLEGSGVFATYKLQTNYRSNQEILNFANATLRDIEANQYAKIQLQANSLTPVTKQSFQDAVRLQHERIKRQSEINDIIANSFAKEIHTYVSDKLSKGEQVAFLAYSRRHVKLMQELLQKTYPSAKIVNLVPEKAYTTTTFSRFIRIFWKEMSFAQHTNIISDIAQKITLNLDRLIPYASDKALAPTQRLIGDWMAENNTNFNTWIQQANSGIITNEQLLDNIRDSMLAFETKQNHIRQTLTSQKNQTAKANNDAANADIILSTIHSAKGLEFPHVVVLYHAENQMEEDRKRMYYVAFTRAMKSEYILAYSNLAQPNIEIEYNHIIKSLP